MKTVFEILPVVGKTGHRENVIKLVSANSLRFADLIDEASSGQEGPADVESFLTMVDDALIGALVRKGVLNVTVAE